MYELVIENNGKEHVVYSDEDVRMVELVRQRHVRSLTVGKASIREVKDEKK
ncbi:hypothetical protein [Pseudodesulfovibrio cashew]|uniref:hypothetical protein n=1 Tax=Pseudodesulfovibrio cashew TaxID=2678688 RepID=UPI0018EF2E9D|nr:hypothetical protein [Pseudodesulfovibrio cashew]